jgi:hypothetical protein
VGDGIGIPCETDRPGIQLDGGATFEGLAGEAGVMITGTVASERLIVLEDSIAELFWKLIPVWYPVSVSTSEGRGASWNVSASEG